MRIGPEQGVVVEVRTFREGVLSAVGHDLRLVAPKFALTVDGDASAGTIRGVTLIVDARALVVDGAVVHGAVDTGALSAGDRRDIERALRDDVLGVTAHPEIAFRAEAVRVAGDAFAIDGVLTLAGRERPLTAHVARDGDAFVSEVPVHQPDFGIRPFRAMLGALKVRADVSVRVRVPRAALGLAP